MPFITLENTRVRLAPLKESSFNDLFPIAKNMVMPYSPSPIHTAADLKNYLLNALEDPNTIPFIIFDKQKQRYAGSTRFYMISKPNKRLTIGYTWLGKEFQGTKLNQNMKYLMLQYAFETLQMERIEFYADLLNKQSIQAMKKIGCVEEGVLRSHTQMTDRRRDTIVLSILKDEWFMHIKNKLHTFIKS